MDPGYSRPDWTSSTGEPDHNSGHAANAVAARSTQLSPEERSHIASQLELARKDLLDLGLRNPLLNSRLRKASGVAITNPGAHEIFGLLVQEGRSLTFAPAEEEGPEDDSTETRELEGAPTPDAAYEAAEDEVPTRRSSTPRVRTAHSRDELQRRLVNTYRLARTALEEQGVNTLFVALGVLTWYESDSSEIPRHAPLALVPVALERSSRGTRFALRFTDDDVGVNLSLLAKLQTEFGITLPENHPLETAEDLHAYFSAVAHSVEGCPRWSVDATEAALGFFSFAKFLMFRDLDPQACVSEQAWPGSGLLRALFGSGFSAHFEGEANEDELDRQLHPQKILQVYDADSTQTAAIIDAQKAPCLVIQGPPGTGKSQTITNLIAEAVGTGKTVLFVAEKRAALEVVRRRLANAGLADICLELHSNKASKRAVLDDLKRTYHRDPPRESADSGNSSELVAQRDRLNAYSAAMNTPVGESSTTPYEAMGRLLRISRQLQTGSLPRQVRDLCTDGWTQDQFRKRSGLLKEIEQLRMQSGDLTANPFWGSGRRSYLPADKFRIAELAETAEDALASLMAECDRLAKEIGEQPINSVPALDRALAIAGHLIDRPPLQGVSVRHEAWATQGERIASLLSMAEWLAESRSRHGPHLAPEAWRYDLSALHGVLAGVGQRWYRSLVPSYREAIRELRGLFVGEPPTSARDQISVVKDIMRAQVVENELRRAEVLLRDLFGPQRESAGVDRARLASVVWWLVRLHKGIVAGEVPREILDVLETVADGSLSQAACEKASELRCAYTRSLERLIEEIFPPAEAGEDCSAGSVHQEPFSSQMQRLRAWKEHPEALREIADHNNYMAQLANEGLQTWVELVLKWDPKDGTLPDLLSFAWHNSVLNRASRERDALARFRRIHHDAAVRAFRQLDHQMIETNRSRVLLAHWERSQAARTLATSGQVGILRQEFEKRRRHLPIRKLMERAGIAIQQLKPVFMMSPLSVAGLIPKGRLQFDLVIFDEASQIRPVEALGSILRGDRAIVIGDSRQLPPTSFFDKLYELDDDEEMDTPTDMESVLGLFCAKGSPERMLRWHYRSRHHSLIAVSNQEFYDNRLIVFPNPAHMADGMGVVLRHLPDTAYVPGTRRAHNPLEAEAVARAVVKHGEDFPDLSLGVVAFSKSQADLIEDYVERERRRDDSPEGFFAGHPEEPFFVKNLENVQGDERDVMFISVGYGRQQSGKLSLNFGPLNQEGGERRLNVLITRARHRCEVFCNFRADDLPIERGTARGVSALKQYLQYAETRDMEVAEASDREPGSPFEEEVADALRAAGHQVHHQVGSGGYFLDLGVVDPVHPGRYLLGIECDGASYHSAKWARDRDRLRQQVLEDRDWRIHRIWSTDWFDDPVRETRRLAEAVELAGRPVARSEVKSPGWAGNPPDGARNAAPEEGVATSRATPTTEGGSQPQGLTARPYRRAEIAPIVLALRDAGSDFHRVRPHMMSDWVKVVVDAESPVHTAVIAKRLREGAGLQRTGSRIVESVRRGLGVAASRGLLTRKGDFAWSEYVSESEPRDRSGLPPDERSIDLIAPEEVAGAVVMVVRASLGLQRDDLVSEVARLFGFGRTSEGIQSVVQGIVERMRSDHRLVERAGYLHLAG